MKLESIRIPREESSEVSDLRRLLERERRARILAEATAERGLRELYESQIRLALLQRVTDNANRSSHFNEALTGSLSDICQHMGWAFGNAYRIAPDGQCAMATGVWYADEPDRLFSLIEVSRQATFAIGQGLPGRALRDGHPHWIDTFSSESWFCRGPEVAACQLVSACAFPVMIGEDVVAIVEFFSRKPMVDKDAILLTLSQASNQLARVIERERASAILLHDALHDAMTGLPNRVLLAERSRSAFDRLPADRSGLAVMVIDLDGFKAINDKLGHHAGDGVLVEVAHRFERAIATLRDHAGTSALAWRVTLARVGGDEFVVLLDGLTDSSLPQRLANALIEVLRDPIRVDGDHLSVGASIGIAHSSPATADIDQIRRDADLAMYEAKAGGRGGIITFSEELGNELRNRMALERELRDAIRENQFVLYYQPIFALDGDRELRGFEALIRWNHPTRGLVEPGAFIPAAEASGLIIFIGDWVLSQACEAMARLYHQLSAACEGGAPAPDTLPFVSVNIAPLQFLQPNFVANVERVLAETGVPPQCLRLEVTEGVAIIDADRTRDVLEQVRAWGVHTSLDDFGTGYSSLSYLQNLPFDTLKIDRAFIASMDDPKSRKIIRAILDLAENLNLSVVAEGIETSQQGEALVEMGCGLGQGYHLARPLEEARAFALALPPSLT